MAAFIDLLSQYGLAFVFVCVLVEQAGAPVPAYPVLMATGALAARGQFPPGALLVVAVVACLLSDLAWYLTGQRLGSRVLRVLCRVSLSPDGCVRQTESIFGRFGAPSLMAAKFVPGFATVATTMAGSTGVRLPSFLLFDAIGAALWAGVALTLGWIFNDAIDDLLDTLAALGRWGGMLILVALGLFIAMKWWNRRQFRARLRMDRISVSTLADLMQRGEAPVIVDVRSHEAQRSGRIPNAIALRMDDADGWHQRVDAPAPDTLVVVYCACPNEATAAVVAKKLLQRGFSRVRPLEGGIDAWVDAGFDLARDHEGASGGEHPAVVLTQAK
ncbi:MAG TPA: DedA family protein/thiosulfate sulfurtransferase GlpE [Burkholderiaceae bacterium]|jgi:membrane protein DedA with SNARE-associated domain/rhodanese-related sulfurtransferase|nr:DedA family protein/thiosulfate sulfurtransferase GlpE [Burkholderiaceae bacterium]